MPVFKYKGYKLDGSPASDVIEASGYSDALAKIKAEGLFAEEIKEQTLSAGIGLRRISPDAFLPAFTRNLSTLLDAGVQLVEALESLAAEYTGKERELVIAIKEGVVSGAALHRTLEDFRDIFPEFYISMVQAGEKSASLEKVLQRLALFLEAQSSLKSKVKNALIYPLFMTGISCIVLTFIFVFVIPKITRIFKDMNTQLPFITKVLIGVSSFVVDYWWLLFILLIAIVFIAEKMMPRYRRVIDRALMKMPGSVVQSLYYSRLARTLAYLLEGGVPVLTALRFASRSTGNSEIESHIVRAEGALTEGLSLSGALKGFPPLFIQLVSTGEKGGRLFDTLNRAADIYEEEFNKKVTRLVAVFEPAIIVIMGILVCIIVLAVLLPLFQMNQLIK